MESLEQFSAELRQEVINIAETEEVMREEAFTSVMFGYLSDASEFDDGVVCTHRAHGMQINGYCISDDEEQLDIAVSICQMTVPAGFVGKQDIQTALKRAYTFITKCILGYYASLEESSPVFDLALRIHELKDQLGRIRIFLLTDGRTKGEGIEEGELNGIPVHYQVWDVERLYRCWTSGRKREALEIDFEEATGNPVPCIFIPNDNPDYITYLAILPAQGLAKIYEEYGPRLLERNVRSFLQVRGSVNKGIRNTINKEPHMFLAYNNGLSATAEFVELIRTADGQQALKLTKDLQIVNGGQTTASIYHAWKKDKADLSHIFIQFKLTVLKDPEKMDIIVPRISEYANSQNKVQSADFSANDPFHREIEELSRTIWAPVANGGQRQTKWFYERSRGQYADAKGREGTPARQKVFESNHPKTQLFTKTDLAKYENAWNQLPQFVSKGAQRSFQEFTVRLKEKGSIKPNQKYFEHLVAKAILFKRTEKLVQAENFGGYRANIVAYTIAWISHETSQRIDLERIWLEQALSPVLEKAITQVSHQVYDHIVNTSKGANVTEYCKRDICWQNLLKKQINLPADLESELILYGQAKRASASTQDLNETEKENISRVKAIPAETWFAIASWAKETNNLLVWQRSISVSLGKLSAQSKDPSRKQA
ncbi:AIPR family protein, partial [Brevibacillus choshinensis]